MDWRPLPDSPWTPWLVAAAPADGASGTPVASDPQTGGVACEATARGDADLEQRGSWAREIAVEHAFGSHTVASQPLAGHRRRTWGIVEAAEVADPTFAAVAPGTHTVRSAAACPQT